MSEVYKKYDRDARQRNPCVLMCPRAGDNMPNIMNLLSTIVIFLVVRGKEPSASTDQHSSLARRPAHRSTLQGYARNRPAPHAHQPYAHAH